MNENLEKPSTAMWPLLFRYRGPVMGSGFVAIVALQGRLLARQEDEGFWLDGVNPGALSLAADSMKAANLELRTVLTGVLTDLAEQVPSFDDFKRAVEEFFNTTDDDTVAEWDTAVVNVQKGRLSAPGLLPVFPANSPLVVEVTRKTSENVTPSDNAEPEPLLGAVA